MWIYLNIWRRVRMFYPCLISDTKLPCNIQEIIQIAMENCLYKLPHLHIMQIRQQYIIFSIKCRKQWSIWNQISHISNKTWTSECKAVIQPTKKTYFLISTSFSIQLLKRVPYLFIWWRRHISTFIVFTMGSMIIQWS